MRPRFRQRKREAMQVMTPTMRAGQKIVTLLRM